MFSKVIMVGTVCGNPAVRQTKDGTAMASFWLKLGRKDNREKTDMVLVTAWRLIGEIVADRVTDGVVCVVSGRVGGLAGKQEKGRRRIEIIADEVWTLGNLCDPNKSKPPAIHSEEPLNSPLEKEN